MAKIKDVDLDLPVEFSAYHKKDCLIGWIENTEVFIMQPKDAKSFISELNENDLLELIEESLQSLAQRNDGTQLLTAMPYLSEVKAVFSELSSVPNELLSLLAEWEVLGCNIVDISFVDNLKRWQGSANKMFNCSLCNSDKQVKYSKEKNRLLCSACLDSLIEWGNEDLNFWNDDYSKDHDKFNDILSQYSTTELYKMWQNSEIGTTKSIFLEKTIKIRTGKFINELEKDEFKTLTYFVKESEFDFLSQDTRSEPCYRCEKPYNQCSCNYENNEVTK